MTRKTCEPLPSLVLVVLTALAAVISFGATCSAEEIIIPISDWCIIVDSTGSSRILLKFADLDTLNGMTILDARCQLTIQGDSCDNQAIDLAVEPLTTSWNSGSTSWSSPWQQPGGDKLASFRIVTQVGLGEGGATSIGVGGLLQAWIDNRISNCGLMVSGMSYACGLSLTADERYPPPYLGALYIRCTRKP